jgi:hypothetical protein
MKNTIPVPVASAKVLAEFFEEPNPHHLVVAAVFAGKELRALLDGTLTDEGTIADEREAFEASFQRRHSNFVPGIDLARDENGDYSYQPASVEWPVWQARAEQAPGPVITMRSVMLAIESANATSFIKGTSNWCAHVARKLNAGFPEHDKAKGHCINGDHCVCGGDTAGVRAQCGNWVHP